MRRLAGTAELLDGPLDDPVALAGNLRDLRRINRWLGGVELSRRALAALVGRRSEMVSFLDVGTGAADIPLALARSAGSEGHPPLSITAIDSRPEVVEAARRLNPELRDGERLRLDVGDGQALSAADRSHDVVHASLILHHLSPDEAVTFLAEMRRVARVGVIVNDLNRSRLGWIGAWLLGRLATRNRLTRHDAPLSVLRAYTPSEMKGLMARAGLRPVYIAYAFLRHRYAIAAVASGPTAEVAATALETGP
jgi:ubiquinone/menaquinone biosynthesis C-methylase UbiE